MAPLRSEGEQGSLGRVKVTQRKSTIGCPPDQKGTMRALGLRKIGTSVVKADNPTLRGMLFKVKHLIEVETSKSEDARG